MCQTHAPIDETKPCTGNCKKCERQRGTAPEKLANDVATFLTRQVEQAR